MTEESRNLANDQSPAVEKPNIPLPPPATTTGLPRATAAVISVTEAELHYKSLIDFLKYIIPTTLAAITILIAVGSYFNYRDMAAMRSDVRQNLLDVKSDVRQNLIDAKADSKAAVESIRDQAKTAIDSEITQIRGRSSAIAIAEAQRRVDEAFRSTNVQTLVEDAARRQVGPVIERNVAEQVDRVMVSLQEDISLSSRIADAGYQMRSGMRSGWTELISLQKTAPSERSRKNAKMILDSIANSYEYYRQKDLHENPSGPGNAIGFLDEGEAIKKGLSVPSGLIKLIRTNEDLIQVSYAFIALREATGYQFRMFDIDAVDKWCAEHPAECKK